MSCFSGNVSLGARKNAQVFYNTRVRTWEVIIVGGGIIGLSLALALRKRGMRVLIVERGEAGREASYAAAGMIADFAPELPPSLLPLAIASAGMYPEFVHDLQDESGMNVDLRDNGTLLLSAHAASGPGWKSESETQNGLEPVSLEAVAKLEPELKLNEHAAFFRKERSVDPRALTAAAIQAAKHREIDIVSGNPVERVMISAGRVSGVSTGKTAYSAPVVVNCAGAWAGNIPPYQFPTRPVKGQILAVIGAPILRHVVRGGEVYLVPRTDGRILVGATLENVGYDKRVDPDVVQRLQQSAIEMVPALRGAKLHQAWAGLRPGTADALPILGETAARGYFVASGHYRDGILLAPITAKVMAQVICGEKLELDLSAFSPLRFEEKQMAMG
ncbi:MAG TPA: glycine oxidase ThiO [Terriglobales bacterium]|jgi:glycine oxidase